jgi:glycosyltransferase involved in cell wall biosynthesis
VSEVTIDVIIPVYNGLPYVLKTLSGVANQTLRPTQVIIVNDGSTDNTLSALEDFKKENPLIAIKIINKKNGGHSSATNEGIRASTSDYIALVDADDLWHPAKLEKQISVFQNSKDPLLGVVYTGYINIDPNDIPLDYPTVKTWAKGRILEELITRGNLVTGSNSAVMMKKEVFADHGFFDEDLKCSEDWEMWIRIARTYHYDFVPEVLTYIRRHEGNLSNLKMLHCKSEIYVMNKWKNEFLKVGGHTLVADYFSRTTFSNLFNIMFNREYDFLLRQLQNIVGFSTPRLVLVWAMCRKIRKKIFKILKVK